MLAEADTNGTVTHGRRKRRWTRRVAVAFLALALVSAAYLGGTLFQVWRASTQDQARPAQAILVLGAAQYNGRPSPDLKARLDHALDLFRRGLAPVVVVTGGRQPGDRFTEATASADYLLAKGVPDSALLREVTGHTTWESLAAATRFLHQRGVRSVLLVSDPFHSKRLAAMTAELGLVGYVSPTRTSPIAGFRAVPYFLRETVAVALGRVVGYRRLVELRNLRSLWG